MPAPQRPHVGLRMSAPGRDSVRYCGGGSVSVTDIIAMMDDEKPVTLKNRTLPAAEGPTDIITLARVILLAVLLALSWPRSSSCGPPVAIYRPPAIAAALDGCTNRPWLGEEEALVSSAIQSIYLGGVPHTDARGTPRSRYDAVSFFPRCIYHAMPG